MGNIDSRAQFKDGYLYVKTDKPFYYPGNRVYGKIYIRALNVINANFLEIRVKGKEKAKFTTHHDDSETRHKMETKHIDCKMTAFTFQGPLQPGDYIIPFEFDLPHDVPASVMWKRKDSGNNPSVKVKNTIKAIVHMHDKQVMKYK